MQDLRPQGRCNKANQRQHRNHHLKYERYKILKKYERGHIERIERHMKRYKDNSPMVVNALEKYRVMLRGK